MPRLPAMTPDEEIRYWREFYARQDDSLPNIPPPPEIEPMPDDPTSVRGSRQLRRHRESLQRYAQWEREVAAMGVNPQDVVVADLPAMPRPVDPPSGTVGRTRQQQRYNDYLRRRAAWEREVESLGINPALITGEMFEHDVPTFQHSRSRGLHGGRAEGRVALPLERDPRLPGVEGTARLTERPTGIPDIPEITPRARQSAATPETRGGYHPTQEPVETPERRPATPQTPEQESRRAELRRRHNELVEQRIRAGEDDPARDTPLEAESALLDDIVEDVSRFSDDFRAMSTLPGQDPRDDDAFRDTLRRGHQLSAEASARGRIEQDQRQHRRAEQERVNREYWDQQARLPR